MDQQDFIEALESEWSPEGGFFWRLREGFFGQQDFERTLRMVTKIELKDDMAIPLRLVSLLWYIPVFMEWQQERIAESGNDATEYLRAKSLLTNEIQRILGVP